MPAGPGEAAIKFDVISWGEMLCLSLWGWGVRVGAGCAVCRAREPAPGLRAADGVVCSIDPTACQSRAATTKDIIFPHFALNQDAIVKIVSVRGACVSRLGCRGGGPQNEPFSVSVFHCRRVVCACSAGTVGSLSSKSLSMTKSLSVSLVSRVARLLRTHTVCLKKRLPDPV